MLGYLPDLPDSRDLRYHDLPQDSDAPLASKVDLRPISPPIYTEGALNSCSANPIAALLEIERAKVGLADFLPSRLFFTITKRSMEGSPGLDNGIRDGIKSIAAPGVCHEEDWPSDLGARSTDVTAQFLVAIGHRFQGDEAAAYDRPKKNFQASRTKLTFP